jgi:hypothetical protein
VPRKYFPRHVFIVGSTNSRHLHFYPLPFTRYRVRLLQIYGHGSKNWSDENSYPPTITTDENICLESRTARGIREKKVGGGGEGGAGYDVKHCQDQ